MRKYLPFLKNLVTLTLKLRYRGTVLGFFWLIGYPLIYLAVLSVIFSKINRWDLKDYAVYLFSGLVPWRFFEMATLNSTEAITANWHYLSKIYVPPIIFPLRTFLVNIIDFLVSFISLFILLMFFKARLSVSLIFLPISISILSLFVLSFCIFFSCFTVFFTDLKFIASLGFTLWFFSSPILFKPDILSGKYQYLVTLNPIFYFIKLFQDPVYHYRLPPLSVTITALIIATSSLCISLIFFAFKSREFYYYL